MLDFEQCWAALESRGASASSGFFYGVRTTGVYCRPGCTSRLPLRLAQYMYPFHGALHFIK